MKEESLHRTSVRLAAKTGYSPRTCLRWLQNAKMSAGVETALTAAAKRLGIERGEK